MSRTQVGWFLPRSLEARAIWYDPAPYTWEPGNSRHSPLFQHCPAYQKFAENLYVIRCPFDLHLRCQITEDGCELAVGDEASIKGPELARLIKVHPRSEWREPDKPLFQMMLNYYFISDSSVILRYLSPLTTTYFSPPLPGLVLQGAWDIRSWVRPVNFVFEWWDIERELVIKRGRPILHVLLTDTARGNKVSLIEAEETDDVIAMARRVQNVNSYIRNVMSVLPEMTRRRPRKLLKPCTTKRPSS